MPAESFVYIYIYIYKCRYILMYIYRYKKSAAYIYIYMIERTYIYISDIYVLICVKYARGELQRGRGRPRRAFAPPLANNYMTPGLGPTFPFPVPGGRGGGGGKVISTFQKLERGPEGGQKSFQTATKNKHYLAN